MHRTIVARRVVSNTLRTDQETEILTLDLEDVKRALRQGEPDPSQDSGGHWQARKTELEMSAKYGSNSSMASYSSSNLPPQEYLDEIR